MWGDPVSGCQTLAVNVECNRLQRSGYSLRQLNGNTGPQFTYCLYKIVQIVLGIIICDKLSKASCLETG